MPSLLEFFRNRVEEDRGYLLQSMAVSRQCQEYRVLASQNASPSSDVIAQANYLRVIQFGEAIKSLVMDGILHRDDVLFSNYKAKDIIVARDECAHPRRQKQIDKTFLEELASQCEVVREKFEMLLTRTSDSSHIRSSLDALTNLSRGEALSPTVWRDAEYYLEIVRCTHLEPMSQTGKKVLDSYDHGLMGDLLRRRNSLSHGRVGDLAIADPTDRLEQCLEHLSPELYVSQILGNRQEPEIEDIVQKWVVQQKGSHQAMFGGRGSAIILDEFIRLAKEGVSVSSIQTLNNLLENAALRPPENFSKHALGLYPKGLPEDIRNSLINIGRAAKAVETKDKPTNSNLNQAIDLVASELDVPCEPAVSEPIRPKGGNGFTLHVYGV